MRAFVLATTIALTGCATAPAPHKIDVAYDPAEVSWFRTSGNNTIRGSAVMRTVAGDVKTCAGLDANLVPDSTYARARFAAMYGSGVNAGFLSAKSGFTFADDNPEYLSDSRTTTCDPQGHFTFPNLADGTYFITAKVLWGIPNQYFTNWQGGYLMRRVDVSGGEVKEIVLSH